MDQGGLLKTVVEGSSNKYSVGHAEQHSTTLHSFNTHTLNCAVCVGKLSKCHCAHKRGFPCRYPCTHSPCTITSMLDLHLLFPHHSLLQSKSGKGLTQDYTFWFMKIISAQRPTRRFTVRMLVTTGGVTSIASSILPIDKINKTSTLLSIKIVWRSL